MSFRAGGGRIVDADHPCGAGLADLCAVGGIYRAGVVGVGFCGGFRFSQIQANVGRYEDDGFRVSMDNEFGFFWIRPFEHHLCAAGVAASHFGVHALELAASKCGLGGTGFSAEYDDSGYVSRRLHGRSDCGA